MSWLTTGRTRSDLGATTAEYALVLAGIAGAALLAFALLVPAVGDQFGRAVCSIGLGCEAPPAASRGVDPWDHPDPVRRATWGKVAILGDSYSSGEGAGDYGAALSAMGCHASEQGYGPRLASRFDIGRDSFRIAACTGATLAHLDDPYADHAQPPQLGVLDADTSLVAMTIGGNDTGWGRAIASCVMQNLWDASSDCVPGTERARDIEASIDAIRPRLIGAFRAVRTAAPHARVVAMGYPRFFPQDPDRWVTWSTVAAFSPESQRWANEMTDRLNDELASAAARAGIEFVAAGDAFAGHELTTAEPWLHGVDVDRTTFHIGPIPFSGPGAGANSFHPTAEGQRALADLVERQIRLPATPVRS